MLGLKTGIGLVVIAMLMGCEPSSTQGSVENTHIRVQETIKWPEALEPIMSPYLAKVKIYDVDPFDLGLIAGEEVGPIAPQDHGGIAPDNQREREPLEFFSLDEIQIVGLLSKHGRESVIVRQPSGSLTTLTIGNYMGKHHGRVISIDRDAVVLIELRRHAGGYWLEREVRLPMVGLGQKARVIGNDGE